MRFVFVYLCFLQVSRLLVYKGNMCTPGTLQSRTMVLPSCNWSYRTGSQVWEANCSHPQEQQKLLTTEPCLHPQCCEFYIIDLVRSFEKETLDIERSKYHLHAVYLFRALCTFCQHLSLRQPQPHIPASGRFLSSALQPWSLSICGTTGPRFHF